MFTSLTLTLAFAVGAPALKPEPQAKGPGYLGVRFQKTLNPDGSDGGLLITDVMPNSPSHTAGLKPNDVILKLDGENMKDADTADLIKIIAGMRPGTTIPIEIKRGNESLTVKVKLGVRPADFEQMQPRLIPGIVPPIIEKP